jgi:hypothetical protein
MQQDTEAGCSHESGACAMGAGAAVLTCKGMMLGFVGGALALVGLSGISQLALTIGVLVIGGALAWRGFRWAGRKPALIAIGGLVTMWIGYAVSGGLVYGNWVGAEFGGEVWLNDPILMVPVALLYIAGTIMFGWAAYDSFGKQFETSKGAMGAGIAGASVCGGCGITGLVGGIGVALTGSAALKRPSAYIAMLIAALIVLAYTLYRRQWKQSAVVAVGSFVAIPLPRFILTFPKGPIAEVASMLITYIGIAIVFYGLVWAYYPGLRLLPADWSLPSRPREAS